MKLVIQTSSGQALLCLINGRKLVARQPDAGQEGPRIQDRDLASLTRALLTSANVAMADLTGLAVDIGPGRLAATRMAVAFVNALAFARKLPLQALPAFQLLASEAARQQAPAALILRKASGKRYYWARSDQGLCTDQGMCRTQALGDLLGQVPKETALVTDFALPLPGIDDPHATGLVPRHMLVKHAEPETLIPLLETWPSWTASGTPFPLPLTEQAFSQSLE